MKVKLSHEGQKKSCEGQMDEKSQQEQRVQKESRKESSKCKTKRAEKVIKNG